MAKAKTKATNLPVPQSDDEAEALIARLGALQRDHAADRATHDGQVAALEEKFGTQAKVFEEVQSVIVEALNVWATANRDRLTGGGKTKTVELPSGKLLWRDGRYAVKHRGLRIEDVIRAVAERIKQLDGEIAQAMMEKRKDDALALREQLRALIGFLRQKVELNKEAMLAAREVAETIPGVTVPRGPEEFSVEPLASQIREVA